MNNQGRSNPPWIQQKQIGQQMGFAPNINLQQQLLQNQAQMQNQQMGQFLNQYQAQPMIHMNQLHQVQAPVQHYNTARVNPMAFQQNPHQQQNQNIQQTQSNSKYNSANKNFSGTGVVTKIQKDIGFIDDEVLFHKSVCVGKVEPKIGDLVLLEAKYNPNLPFKWNAERVQTLKRNSSGPGGPGPAACYNTASNSNNDNYDRGGNRGNRYSPERKRSPDRRPRSRERREEEENERKRRRDVERKTSRSPVRRSRDLPSPKRRRTRIVPRYSVQIPKVSLTLSAVDIVELKKRYLNLYIPSDFTNSRIKWIDAFQPTAPFSVNKTCSFHVMNKEVLAPEENDAVIDPPDADYIYSAKVMLMATPPIEEMYKKCFAKAEDLNSEKNEDEREFFHPTRLISFLVGLRGKNEAMAIGGPWSKKLDGDNPQSDPNVLIKTAIRTCKALTGIDLSKCTQWYRFVELYYRRSDQTKEKTNGASAAKSRIETTVIFLPDVSSLMPNRGVEWDDVCKAYSDTLEKVILSHEKPEEEPIVISDDNSDVVCALENVDPPIESGEGGLSGDAEKKDETVVDITAEEEPTEPTDVQDESKDDETKDSEGSENQLDPKNMKVAELRVELENRGLSSKGLKQQLVERLEEALLSDSVIKNEPVVPCEETADEKMETDEVAPEDKVEDVTAVDDDADKDDKSKDDGDQEINMSEMDIDQVTVIDEYDSTKCDDEKQQRESKKSPEVKKLDAKEKERLEKRYKLPENPHIVVHPSKTAKSGKFDCSVMSLSVLLDYRPEDTKEHMFEVSLFAELFNEMLTRDFGFNILKAVTFFPQIKAKEESKANDDDKKKENSEQRETVESSEKKESKTENENDDKKKKPLAEDSDDNRSVVSSRREVSSSKETKAERPKYVTAFPDLLLSFIYFDITRCGYIFEKDLEELFYSLGLGLARSQIRKLIEKFVSRDAFYYRKLTDRLAESAHIDPYENVTEDQLKEIIANATNESASIKSTSDSTSAEQGLVQFNGALVSLHSLMERMNRSEAARLQNEKLLLELREKNEELTNANARNERKIKDLSSDLKSVNRKLQDSESSLSSATRKYQDYFSVLQSVNDRVAPVIAKNEKARERERERKERKDHDKEKKKDEDKQDKTAPNASKSDSESKSETVEIVDDAEVTAEKKAGEA